MRERIRSLIRVLAGWLILMFCVFGVRAEGATIERAAPAILHPGVIRTAPAAPIILHPGIASTAPAAPVVRIVEPDQLAAGGTYTLTLSGANFQPFMQLDFGPGVSLKGPVAVAKGGGSARVAVQIAQTAPAGRRLVIARISGLQNEGPGYVNIIPAAAANEVVLSYLSPRFVQQGRQATLTLWGSGFQAGMALSFGPGITAAGPVRVTSPTNATLSIQVAPLAPAMLRHPALLLPGRQTRVSADATLTVTAGPNQPAAAGLANPPVQYMNRPAVFMVSPARLFTGQDYTLTLRGVNFVPQMQVDFGAGIVQNGGLRIQSPSLATIEVTVKDSAPPGMRRVGLQAPPAQSPASQDAFVMVQKSAVSRSFAPNPMPVSYNVPVEGTIVLDTPLYSMAISDIGTEYDIPVINERTDLQWHEANPGLADRYEVRFYHKTATRVYRGKMFTVVIKDMLVAKRSITARFGYALPHHLLADPSLLAELEEGVQGRAPKTSYSTTSPPTSWDLTWQVVGFRTYSYSLAGGKGNNIGHVNTAGNTTVSQGQGHEVEVERSKLVPASQPLPNNGDPLLNLLSAPTGLMCGSPPPAAPPGNSLLLENLSSQSTQSGGTQAADYVGDRLGFKSSFDLSNAPWAIDTQYSLVPLSNGQYLHIETLDNVFVDWGDGTVEHLSLVWQDSSKNGYEGGSFDLDNLLYPFAHVYKEANTYPVRVYELPSEDIQQTGALPVSIEAGGGGLYGSLIRFGGQPQGGGGSSVGSLAYMLYCKQETIQHREDPVSQGPLKLVSIGITGFPDAEAKTPSFSGGIPRRRDIAAPRPGANPSGGDIHGERLGGGVPVGGIHQFSGKGIHQFHSGGIHQSNSGGSIPQFNSCDANLIGGARLRYYGWGKVRLTWYSRPGGEVGSTEEIVGPSPKRTDMQLATNPPSAPPRRGDYWKHSPALDLTRMKVGKYQLWVRADVIEDAHPIGSVRVALHDYAAGRLAAGRAILTSGAMKGAPPMGVLGPRGAAGASLPPIEWIDKAPAGAPGVGLRLSARNIMPLAGKTGGTQAAQRITLNLELPPNHAFSRPAPYEVTKADPSKPCTFIFPVQGGGQFLVAGLQYDGKTTVNRNKDNSYSGKGTLIFQVADSTGNGTQPEQVPIRIEGWTMKPDNVTVDKGSFDNNNPGLQQPISVPALTATLDDIAGTAGDKVTATFTASLSNTGIYAANGQSPPPWSNVKATLSPNGDWYADGLPIPPLLVYDSGFYLTADSVMLNLSQSNQKPMGVLFNKAKLSPFSFDLTPPPPPLPVTGWAIDDYNGFSGTASFGPDSFTIDRGSLSWQSISATASQGSFSATYNNLRVHVPWLNKDLTSSQAGTQLTAGRNTSNGTISLNLTSNPTTLAEGPITLTASPMSFASVQGVGWAVKSDTIFSFQGEQKQFASGIAVHGFDYGMDGAAYFDDGSATRHIDLTGQQGYINGSVVALKSVDVQTSPPSSPTRLSFAFDTALTISQALPQAEAPVSYQIAEPSQGRYTGSGPVVLPFKLEKPFPDANPSVDLHLTPAYVGSSSQSGPHIVFAGGLDMGMFGSGSPVSGKFVLGYANGDDFWLARAVLDLGPGVSLAPVPLSLYQVGGGMGYNVTAASFQADPSQVQYVGGSGLKFDVNLLMGSSDHTTFGLDGDFIIQPGGQDPGGGMYYQAWLLNPDWSGQGPFNGHLSFSGGVFDGTLSADLQLLGGQVELQAMNDAVQMHVDGNSGQWYFHLGTQQNPVQGKLFYLNGDAWADLGTDGFALGLQTGLNLDLGDCGSVGAFVHDNWQVQAAITPSPSLALSANANSSLDVGLCVDHLNVSYGTGVSVALALPPPYLDFGYSLSACPAGKANVNLQVEPSVNINAGVSIPCPFSL